MASFNTVCVVCRGSFRLVGNGSQTREDLELAAKVHPSGARDDSGKALTCFEDLQKVSAEIATAAAEAELEVARAKVDAANEGKKSK